MENVGFYHTNSNVCLKNDFRIHFERMSANDVDIFKSQKILIEKIPSSECDSNRTSQSISHKFPIIYQTNESNMLDESEIDLY